MTQGIKGMNLLGESGKTISPGEGPKQERGADDNGMNFFRQMAETDMKQMQRVQSPTSPSPTGTRIACVSPPHMIQLQSLSSTPQGPNTPRDTPCITPSVYSPTREGAQLTEAEGARITRQIEDLKITNMTLTQINQDLEAQVRKQQQELKQLRERRPSATDTSSEYESSLDHIDASSDLSSTTKSLLESMGVKGLGRPTQLDKCLELSSTLLQEYSEAVHSVGNADVGVRVKGL
ncbi:hypothetical protein CJU89_1786 [Yarrowia sp. B02]|nr:hypothetical protein CJU89_1786 [Yarrowia sp. B02]